MHLISLHIFELDLNHRIIECYYIIDIDIILQFNSNPSKPVMQTL